MKALKLTALGLLLAIPLAAQQKDSVKVQPRGPGMGMGMGMGMQGHPMMQGMDDMMAPMMGIMVYMPEHLLARKDDLKLTADQVTKLTALQDQSKAAHQALMGAMKPHFDAMNAAFAKGDTAGAQMHVNEAHEAMGKTHASMIGVASQARAVLTDAQRTQVDQWGKDMQGKMMMRGPQH